MTAPDQLCQLVERFTKHRAAYTSGHYKETQVRRDFIDPFFKLLGWDIDNEKGAAEQYRQVIHEDAIKIGGVTKAPDYAFRIGGVPKFFVEAKKPSVNLKDDVPAAFQLRRYAWTGKLPLSILTDFEEFAVYDCRVKPVMTDKATTARIMILDYGQYDARWKELVSLFSPDAILRGSFDAYADSAKKKRGTAEVDDEFLKDIEEWRKLLAQNMALRNPKLTQRELNFVVQRTIDRIVFLRICEDRGIEDYGRLAALREGAEVYPRLCKLFQEADDRYNSGIFHFKPEKGREIPDELSLSVTVDDRPLKEILKRLYYPDSPYEFSVLPAEILGQVYEQFLGSVIHLTAGHHARIEQKPEVRKAGGVYYTPAYIVKYIVENTVGKLLEGKKPGPRSSVNDLRILDPACGSGSFLIAAYQYLVDWHRDRYVEDGPEKHTKELFRGLGGEWRLATDEKQRILLNNIYGVDIDPQAVEVTKLSLLLKVLEGETQESIRKQLQLFKARALPDLGTNIKCGNSLIASDFYQDQQKLFEDADRYRINAFDWQREFAAVFGGGGFDVIIGNPPYIRIQAMTEWAPDEVEFYKRRFVTASKGNYDIYVVFVERGLQLLNERGRLGFILPHKFFNAKYGEGLRSLIAQGKYLSDIVHFGDQQVFDQATTYTCLMFLEKKGRPEFRYVDACDLTAWRHGEQTATTSLAADGVRASDWNFAVGGRSGVIERLSSNATSLGTLADRIAQGIRTSANPIYVLDIVSETSDMVVAHSKHLDETVSLERGLLSRFLLGREIRAFHVAPSGKAVILPYVPAGNGYDLIPEADLRGRFPLTYEYLRRCKGALESREHDRMRGDHWYAYVYPKNIEVMKSVKLLVPDIADRAACAYDSEGQFAFTSGYGIITKVGVRESREYLLGLLNSRVLTFYVRAISTPLRGGFFRYFTQYLEQLPIRRIDFTNARDESLHDEVADRARAMIGVQDRLAKASTAHERDMLVRESADAATRLDHLAYQLFGCTDDEIRVIEETERKR